MAAIDVVDLAGVVYSSGKVFDGLATVLEADPQ